jgi:prepilin-type N-terminal cleavage/methylation domain-containing protein
MMKKGFTIVELLMVIGIIAVLMGIVTTAASESMKASRGRRADALCTLVQSGLAVYYAQKDEWPVDFRGKGGNNQEGANGNVDDNVYVLTGAEVRQCVKALVDEAKKGNPLIDVSGLWVSRSDGELKGDSVNRGAVGLDFMSAVRGTKQHPKQMKTGEMYFGYPDPSTGAFLRFKMTYSVSADQLRVSKQR